MSQQETMIRRARLEDYGDACRLTNYVDELHRVHVPWMFKASDVPTLSENEFAALLSQTDAAVFVADSGHVVGMAVGLLRAAPDRPIFREHRWGVLDGLVVDPVFRRRGLGRRLTHAVENWALESGAPWLELNVYEFNVEARQFYEALGYLAYSTKLRKPSFGAR